MTRKRGGSVKRRMKNFKNTSILICRYCGKKLILSEATVDHKIPRSRGGPDLEWNFTIACHDCNQEKADMTEEEYMIYKKTYGEINLRRDIDIDSVKARTLRNQEKAMERARKDSQIDIKLILRGKKKWKQNKI